MGLGLRLFHLQVDREPGLADREGRGIDCLGVVVRHHRGQHHWWCCKASAEGHRFGRHVRRHRPHLDLAAIGEFVSACSDGDPLDRLGLGTKLVLILPLFDDEREAVRITRHNPQRVRIGRLVRPRQHDHGVFDWAGIVHPDRCLGLCRCYQQTSRLAHLGEGRFRGRCRQLGSCHQRGVTQTLTTQHTRLEYRHGDGISCRPADIRAKRAFLGEEQVRPGVGLRRQDHRLRVKIVRGLAVCNHHCIDKGASERRHGRRAANVDRPSCGATDTKGDVAHQFFWTWDAFAGLFGLQPHLEASRSDVESAGIHRRHIVRRHDRGDHCRTCREVGGKGSAARLAVG